MQTLCRPEWRLLLVLALLGLPAAACRDVTVRTIDVEVVEITGAGNVMVGSSIQLTATPKGRGRALVGRTVAWASSNPSVASVEASGTVRGLTAGAAQITATVAGVSNTVGVSVDNPVPTIASVAPAGVTAGDPPLTLTVHGSGFVASSVVRWNGAPRPTTYVGATQLHALIAAADVATSGTAAVSVANPAPGGGTSNIASFAVRMPPPAAPTNLVAVAASGTRIDLSWVDNSTNEAGFRIERCTGVGCTSFAEIGTVPANVTGYQDTGLAVNTAYRYRVRAYNADGVSAYSNTATASTLGTPAPPSALVATAVSTSQINLSWQDNSTNETEFRIERCTGGACGNFAQIATVAADATTYQNTGLQAGTTYSYRVRACNTSGCSGYSNEVARSTLHPPTPPVISALTGGLVTINSPSCSSNNGSLYRYTFTFSDVNGNVSASVAPVAVAWIYQPSASAGSFDANAVMTGTGFAGTMTVEICARFDTDTSFTNTYRLRDTTGLLSNALVRSETRPVGANDAPDARRDGASAAPHMGSPVPQ